MSTQKETPAIQSSIVSLIKSFFETLTPDQLLLIIAGTLDESIKALMADLISQIIQNLSTVLQAYIRTMDAEVTQELVLSCLGNVVTESFKAALSVTARGQSRSAEVLRDMISEEVLASVQCSMSDAPKEHVPTPKRLEKMQKLTSKMIKSIKKRVFTPHKKGEDLKPSEPITSSPIHHIFNENPLDSLDAIPMDFSSDSPLHSSDKSPIYFSAENPLDVSEKNPLDVSEENPLDVSEENPLDVSKENPLDVSEKNPLDVSEENPLDSLDAIPMDFSSESRLHSSDESSISFSEENPLDVSKEIPLDISNESFFSLSPVDSMKVNFLPTPGREVFSSPTPSDHFMEESRKHAICLIVERLVSLTYSKSNVSYYLMDPMILIERLVARTLAAVEDVYFDPSPKTIVDIVEAIHKYLVKKWGHATLVLTHMKLGTQTVDKFIAEVIKIHLVSPQKKRSSTRRFVSITAKAVPLLCKIKLSILG